MSFQTDMKERGGVVMHDQLYELNQWTNQAVLEQITAEHSLKATVVGQTLPTTSAQPDPVRQALQARQEHLHTLGNSETLIQQARENLMKDARAEFAAVMQQLNQNPQVENTADRIELAAKADQPAQQKDCPIDAYQQALRQPDNQNIDNNDAVTIIAGKPH
jgi:hypothetical protein